MRVVRLKLEAPVFLPKNKLLSSLLWQQNTSKLSWKFVHAIFIYMYTITQYWMTAVSKNP